MSSILQNLVFALNDGASYALIALGYTMVYGVLRLINFAHGDIYMIGAYGGAYVARYFNSFGSDKDTPEQPAWRAIMGVMISMGVCGVLGWAIERVAYRPLRRSPKLSALITAIGVSLLIEYLAQMTWSSPSITVEPSKGLLFYALRYFVLIGIFCFAASWSLATYFEGKYHIFSRPLQLGIGGFSGLLTVVVLRDQFIFSPLLVTWLAIAAVSLGFAYVQIRTAVGRPVYCLILSGVGTVLLAYCATLLLLDILQGQSFFGPNPMPFQPIAGSGNLWTIPVFGLTTIHPGAFIQERLGVTIINKDAVVIITTLLVLAGLYILVKHTRTGKAMRAVSQNYDAARLMGINLDRIISFTFVLGSMLAAVGGCLHGLNHGQCDPLMGLKWGLKAFVAAVIGGIGSIPGAAVGGLALGIIETYVSSIQYHHEAILSPYRDAIAFFILILMLLVKPEGLFGKAIPEKV